MKVEMKMPDLSTASSTVRVVGWLIKPGQTVQRGQPLLEVETDKSMMEVEAFIPGILSEILVPEDTDVEVGQVIGIIETQDEAVPKTKPPTADRSPIQEQTKPVPAAPPVGTKPAGLFARNREKTTQQMSEAKPPVAPTPVQKTGIQWTAANRVVAQRTQESKQTIPHFYLQTSADAEAMIARRNAAPGEKPVWDAFFVYAAGKALKQFTRMCASIRDGQLVAQELDAVGIAVDLEGDLYVVQVSDPAIKTPEQISIEIREQVQRLKAGDPEVRRIRSSNITISNLGAAGIESFTAIINPPESSILAAGKVSPVVAVVDGRIVIQNRISLTLSVDHRVVNGRYAADFLATIVKELESV